jgi:hypothetical protein
MKKSINLFFSSKINNVTIVTVYLKTKLHLYYKFKINMQIEQIYRMLLRCHYITSNGEAAIIDPLRETNRMDGLERDGVKLKYIFKPIST